jgi:hypothetical protein
MDVSDGSVCTLASDMVLHYLSESSLYGFLQSLTL